jgi:hypothetical protein
MKLSFEQHLSAKTRRDVRLKVFPSGEPENFLTSRQEREGDESVASTCEYNFPDDSVVVAHIEFGPAVVGPRAPESVCIEVHTGPEASRDVIAAADAEARKLADDAGVNEQDDNIPGYSGLWTIRH